MMSQPYHYLYVMNADGSVYPTGDMDKWNSFFESNDRYIDWTGNDEAYVSTVFLGINHQFGDGAPILFETMVFGGEQDQRQMRYSTYDEAVAGHKAMCKIVFAKVGVDK